MSFIFEDSKEQMRRKCRDSLVASGGDYFKMLKDLFEVFVITLQETKDMLDMVRNIFSYQENANVMGFGSAPDAMCEEGDDLWTDPMLECIDTSNWRIDLREDFGALMTLGMASLMIALSQYYKCPEKLEQIRVWYDKKLEILRWGACNRVK